jgi:hypothetical protein
MHKHGSLKRSRTDQFDVLHRKPGANTDAKTIRAVEDFAVEGGEVECIDDLDHITYVVESK